ncbi:MAG: hypothetical protein R2705_07445 [Ilumatobacteraceae bacterium]
MALPVLAVLVVSFGSATSAAATPGPDDAPGTGTTVAPTPTTTIPAPSTTEIVISAGTNAPAVPGSNASSNGPASTAPTPTTPDAQAPPIGAVPPPRVTMAWVRRPMSRPWSPRRHRSAPAWWRRQPDRPRSPETDGGSPTSRRRRAMTGRRRRAARQRVAPRSIHRRSHRDHVAGRRAASRSLGRSGPGGDGCTLVVVTELAYDVFRDDDRGTRWDTYRTVLPECRDASDAPGRVEPAQLGAAVGRGRGASTATTWRAGDVRTRRIVPP